VCPFDVAVSLIFDNPKSHILQFISLSNKVNIYSRFLSIMVGVRVTFVLLILVLLVVKESSSITCMKYEDCSPRGCVCLNTNGLGNGLGKCVRYKHGVDQGCRRRRRDLILSFAGRD